VKRKTVGLLMVAIVLGVVGGRLTNRLLSRPPEAERATEGEPTRVLVARRDLAVGLRLRQPEELFEEKTLPAGRVPKNAVTRLDQLAGRVLARAAAGGQPVSADDLLGLERQPAAGAASARRPTRIVVHQADMAVFLPDAVVDVLAARPGEGAPRVVVRGATLLALEAGEPAGGGKRACGVSLAVSPEEAKALARAAAEGPLRLALSAPVK